MTGDSSSPESPVTKTPDSERATDPAESNGTESGSTPHKQSKVKAANPAAGNWPWGPSGRPGSNGYPGYSGGGHPGFGKDSQRHDSFQSKYQLKKKKKKAKKKGSHSRSHSSSHGVGHVARS